MKNSPATNRGTINYLYIVPEGTLGLTSYQTNRAILRFDVSSIDPNAVVVSATLSLYVLSSGADLLYTTTGAYRVQQNPPRDWKEYEVTWNDYAAGAPWTNPGSDFLPAATDIFTIQDPIHVGTYVDYDVTADVIDFVMNPATNFGWMVGPAVPENPAEGGHWVRFGSKEAAPNVRPKLTIEWIGNYANPAIAVQDTFDLGSLGCSGIFKDSGLVVRDTSTATLRIDSVRIAGPDSTNFEVIAPSSYPYNISGNDSDYITIRFNDAGPAGMKYATLQIYSNDTTPLSDSLKEVVLVGKTDSIYVDSLIVQPGTCNESNGAITIGAAGGSGTISYSMDGGPYTTANTFTGLSSGSYVISYRDDADCVKDTTVTVPATGNVSATFNKSDVTCPEGSDGSITVTAAGGMAPYRFRLDTVGAVYQSGNNPFTFSNLKAGTYTVSVKDTNGCDTTTSTITITQPPPIQIADSVTSAGCNENNGNITVSSTGGYGAPFAYSLDGGAFQSNGYFDSLAAGGYVITVMDSLGCTKDTSIGVSNTSGPTITSAAGSQLACHGDDDGTITVSASGAGTLTYTLDSITNTSGDFDSLPAGNYVVSVTDTTGCVAVTSVNITQPPRLQVDSLLIQDVTCDSSNGSITAFASGGSGTITYSLDSSNYSTVPDFTGLAPGGYEVYLQDTNECMTKVAPVIVDSTIAPTAQLTIANPPCDGGYGTATVTVFDGNPPYTYSWSHDTTLTNNIADSLQPGSYTVTVTDEDSCVLTQGFTIVAPQEVSIDSLSVTQATCNVANGAITVYASGGSGSFNYRLNGGSFQSNNSFSGLNGGTFNIRVKDGNNCFKDTTISFTNSGEPVVSVDSVIDVRCPGDSNGAVFLSVSGGMPPYDYIWSTGDTVKDIQNVPSDVYALTVTDSVGCSVVTLHAVNTPFPMQVTVDSMIEPRCYGTSDGSIDMHVSGGNPAYRYSWSNGDTTEDITGLNAGDYIITITDSMGCRHIDTITVEQAEKMNTQTNPDTAVCAGNSLKLYATSSASYYWSPADGLSCLNCQSPTASPDTTTTYQVVVTNAKNCFDTAYVTVAVNPIKDMTIEPGDTTIQEGKSVQLNASDDASYAWMPAAGLSCTDCANPIASPSKTTVYTLYLTDENGCIITDSMQVMVLKAPYQEKALFIPNAFSPNGDNVNDRLLIYDNEEDISSLYLVITSRWGEKVYETASKEEAMSTGWDGTHRGQMLNTGVFAYFLRVKYHNGEEVIRQGDITLFR